MRRKRKQLPAEFSPEDADSLPPPRPIAAAPTGVCSPREENERLRAELAEDRETLRAIRQGEVDAIVVSGRGGERVVSLVGADQVCRLIVETVKEAAVTLSFDGTILFANAPFGLLLKRPLDEVIGRMLAEFAVTECRESVKALLTGSRTEPVRAQVAFRSADGTVVPVYVSSSLLDWPDGMRVCVVAPGLANVENSTELIQKLRRQQEALRESEERYRLAVKATNDAIWDMNLKAGIVNWNDAYTVAFGRPPDTANSWQWWVDHIHPCDRERAAGGLREALDGRQDGWVCEYRFQRVDGGWAHILDRACIARDATGKAWRVVGSMLDLTERIRTEEALREADRRKDEFIGQLAHELRNPLATIVFALELLRRGEAPSPSQQRSHDVISRQVTQLVRLVDDLLDVSRITHGKIQLRKEVFDLVPVIATAVEDQRHALESHGLRLDRTLPDMPLLLDGDRARITQIVGNLLANAAKFTASGGRVTVALSLEHDSMARITVSDTGMGIEPEFLPHVFEPFRQDLRGLQLPNGGLGIGLALVKGVTELHGGTVRVNSDGPGKGAQFIITLPTGRQSASS